MTLMLAPRSGTFVAASGDQFVTDQHNIIDVPLAADVTSLEGAGCVVLSPTPTDLLGSLKSANFNVSTDQLIPFTFIGNCRVKRIVVWNTSVNGMSTAVGGVYTATSKGGSAIVAATQVYTGLTNPTTALELTIALPNLVLLAGTPLYFSLTTPQGVAATADIYVYGDIYI